MIAVTRGETPSALTREKLLAIIVSQAARIDAQAARIEALIAENATLRAQVLGAGTAPGTQPHQQFEAALE